MRARRWVGLKIVAYSIKNYDQVGPVSVDGWVHSLSEVTTSELVVSGNVKLIEVAKAFGVTYISVKRSVKLLREEGPEGFFKQEAKTRTPHVLTDEVVEKVQGYLVSVRKLVN
jgi:predicted transcriptional regulator